MLLLVSVFFCVGAAASCDLDIIADGRSRVGVALVSYSSELAPIVAVSPAHVVSMREESGGPSSLLLLFSVPAEVDVAMRPLEYIIRPPHPLCTGTADLQEGDKRKDGKVSGGTKKGKAKGGA